jgi:hypothetical protein
MATATTTTQPLPQFAPYLNDYWDRSQDVANVGYQQSPGTYVGPNRTLQSGWEAVENRAINGNPAMSAAEQGLQNFYGTPQQGATRNAYGPVRSGTNPYASAQNPYLTQQIDAAQGDVIRNWNNVSRPSWDTAMGQSGSFGNANIQAAAGNAASDMQQNLGRISSDMRMGAYNQAAGLTESGLNRNLGAQQFNANMGEQFAGRSDSVYGQNQNRMLQGYSMAPQFAQNDYLDANALLGVGGMRQGFDQGRQNQRNDWWNDSRNYAGQQLDAYGQRLGIMQPGSSSTQSTPDPSRLNQVVGGAAAGAAILPQFVNWWNRPAGG